jgi:hypothetical protein
MTATVALVSRPGTCGSTSPSANAVSAIETSMFLIVTGGWLIPSTHEVSHGAGQSRPVNSGKLFVACRRSIASSQRPSRARSFHSGMRLPSGQPLWQNGMPQSMQRPAWRASAGPSSGRCS